MSMTSQVDHIGFACAYTPLPLIHAAGFVPYRIFPHIDAPDRAGSLLHDNLCPHVKRILDRALAGNLPRLSGMVIMNSCDAMRRLSDAWPVARPRDRMLLLDLPTTAVESSVQYFARELKHFLDRLSSWTGRPISTNEISRSIRSCNEVARALTLLRRRAVTGTLEGGWRTHQEILNRSVTEPIDRTLAEIEERLRASTESPSVPATRVPIFLFGNVLSDPEAFQLFESCGVQLVGDDLCTGTRQLTPILDIGDSEDAMLQLARGLLSRPICARTIDETQPGMLAEQVLTEATECGARGVIAHVVKFCDPYLARLPTIQQTLRKAGLPLLVLEGDCTLRSLGQHRTRIEAFVETLGGNSS